MTKFYGVQIPFSDEMFTRSKNRRTPNLLLVQRPFMKWMTKNIGYEAQHRIDFEYSKTVGWMCPERRYYPRFTNVPLRFYFSCPKKAALFKLTWL